MMGSRAWSRLWTTVRRPRRLGFPLELSRHGSNKARRGQANREKGVALERRVARLLKKEGRYNVKRNVVLVDRHGNRSEIDVTFDRYPSWFPVATGRMYVECKNYSGSVPLEDVAKFKAVLGLNGIKDSKGIFVTTSKFTPRCRSHAEGIECVDGESLGIWEKKVKAKRMKHTMLLMVVAGVGGGIGFQAFTHGYFQTFFL
jgi:hypothetical protein